MQFLLERLAILQDPATGAAMPFDQGTAVALQIQRILASRSTDGQLQDDGLLDFGMPHVVTLARDSNTQLERFAARLQRQILHYEPRLQGPKVRIEANGPGSSTPYRLVVSGALAADGEMQVFHFDLPAH